MRIALYAETTIVEYNCTVDGHWRRGYVHMETGNQWSMTGGSSIDSSGRSEKFAESSAGTLVGMNPNGADEHPNIIGSVHSRATKC